MKISDRKEFAQKPKPLTCSPTTTVLDAVKQMSANNYGSIIVVNDEQEVIGMMTERDIFRRLIAKELDPKVTKVEEIMTNSVKTAKADDELIDWLRLMSNERFRRLPIVDNHGKLISVMSQGDFVSYTWPELLERFKELTQATLPERINPSAILVSILIYTAAIIFAVVSLT
ncbi:MAG: CBS domain-containing protein [Proteobacteria bacterium]|nr:CBS domain-containing protein [Pseudomonadota bacterium]MDA0914564.1 CBS domain-containing protein [Pseudomonadota bacterium]MDA1033547.1 CBS domain-containing protein [Pseudomonadota bacterium]